MDAPVEGTTREELLGAKDRFGKVDIGGQFIYGQVVEIHSGGDYFSFQRGNPLRFRAKWYHRRDLTLHPLMPHQRQAPADAPVAGK